MLHRRRHQAQRAGCPPSAPPTACGPGISIDDICTPEAWERNPALVWEFYSARRAAGQKAEPNPAHFALAELEAQLRGRFFLCTQNVDDLRTNGPALLHLVHMHGGELARSRCERERGCSPIEDRKIYRNLVEVGPLRLRRASAPAHRLLR